MDKRQVQFHSEHFNLHQLGSGLFAAIAIPGGGAYSNAGIIDLGEMTIIFDAFDTTAAARDLFQAAEEFTNNERTIVTLSHHHFDHRAGLQIFPPSIPVLSTTKTRELIIESENDPDYSIENEIQEMQTYRKTLIDQLESQKDERWQTNLKASISHLDHFINEIPILIPRIPNQTYERKINFYGSKNNAELVHAGCGHTPSDSYLLLPEEKLAFIGDLGFFQCHPYLLDCSPDGWRAILKELEELDVDTIIPGHGPLGTKADLSLLIEYMDTLETNARQAFEAGAAEHDLSRLDIPESFHQWSYGINRFESNIFCPVY